MKIGLCQSEIAWEDRDANYKKAEEFIAQAKEQGTDLLLFPEMSFTGFSMRINKTGETDRKTLGLMQQLALRHGLMVGFGWVELKDGKGRNHYTVVDRQGQVCGDYKKIHPFSYSGENQHFKAGEELVTFTAEGLRFGLQICYDLRFPEPFRVLGESCDCIIVAANWPQQRVAHWQCLLPARAVENQVYVAGINCTGFQKAVAYGGSSSFFDPAGKQLIPFGSEETIYYVEVQDREELAAYRRDFPARADIRWELYESWYRQRREGE